MEIKKSPKADLENRKLLFRELGLIIALGIVLMAFEWKSTEKAEAIVVAEEAVEIEQETIPITTEAPPPPPQAPQMPVLSDQIDIVEDDIVIEEDLFVSLEDNENLGVEIMDYVAETYEEEIIEEAIPLLIVDVKPTFMGGSPDQFSTWVSKNIKYPAIARENGISGRVLVSLTIEKDGSVTNVKVVRGVDALLDKEAVRVVQSSPKWEPARQMDKVVRVTYTVPVTFVLR
ncbi:MAG TPA: energy transducer TonB [Candidatus Coprenecus stercoripullorum]|nr:energy transducer TonB [Candidatus Coprenecus stercoripullorum]